MFYWSDGYLLPVYLSIVLPACLSSVKPIFIIFLSGPPVHVICQSVRTFFLRVCSDVLSTFYRNYLVGPSYCWFVDSICQFGWSDQSILSVFQAACYFRLMYLSVCLSVRSVCGLFIHRSFCQVCRVFLSVCFPVRSVQ